MRTLAIALSLSLATACGGSPPPAPKAKPATEAKKAAPKTKKEPKAEAPKKEEPAKAATELIVDDGTTVTINLEGNDQMQYNTKRIEIPAGRKVKLILTHTGKIPAAAMGHNFVLLKPGTDGAGFAAKAMLAKDSGYIPAELKDSVLANSKVVGGGESTTVEFDAPAAGEYEFLCSFPGHYAMMKGKFIVK